jgi:hypothetical protein
MAYAYAGVCALLALVILPLIIEGEAPRLAIAGQPSLSRPVIPAEAIIAQAARHVQGEAYSSFQFALASCTLHRPLGFALG